MVKELVYAYAMWVSPAFHLKVIRFFDRGVKDGVAVTTMSSREIGVLVETRHDNVKRCIQMLAARGVITLPQFVEVSNPGPGPKIIGAYRLGKRDSFVVVAQLSPEFTGRVVDRWQELEEQVAENSAAPKTGAGAGVFPQWGRLAETP